MSMNVRRILLFGVALVIVVVIAIGFLAGKGERAKEAAREAPVNAPSRMRAVEGPLGDEAAVVLDSAAKVRAGIETEALLAGSGAGGVRLTGELTADPARITTLRAPIPGRLTVPGGHWPALGERVTPGRFLVQVSDARPLTVPRGGTVTSVSAQPGELVQAGQELMQLTDFTVLLARIVWRPEAPRTPPGRITLTPLTPSDAFASARTPSFAPAYLVGPAGDVDSVTRLPVYIYRTEAAWAGARPGTPVEATPAEPGAAGYGVFVPVAAVVQWEGLAWVYVQQAVPRTIKSTSSRFVRRRVDTSLPVPGGWLVTTAGVLGVRAGDRVAVRGAQELLSEEFRSRLTVGEDEARR